MGCETGDLRGTLIGVVAFEPGPEIGYAFATDDHINSGIGMQLKDQPAIVIGKDLADGINMNNELAVDTEKEVPVE